MSRVIAVIGATGAQGLPVIEHLLRPQEDGSPSPWKIRALTRNAEHPRAKDLQSRGVELVQGSFLDNSAVLRLFDGAYGAFVNTDGFTVGMAKEILAAIEIWEAARRQKVRHFVWSSLDYALRIGGYDPLYTADHYNAKGRFADFLMGQKNGVEDVDGTMWTVFTNGPYMDMLGRLFGPMNIRPDGTRVWVSPIGYDGTIPIIALDDLGWWARYIFDHPDSTTGKNLEIASQMTTYPDIVETFQRVTGLPAEYKPVSMDEFFGVMNAHEIPVANEAPEGKTWRANFEAFYSMWKDKLIKRDMEWITSIHPPTTLEKWMREHEYKGFPESSALLKNSEDGKSKLRFIPEKRAEM
ncbi:NAD(P)-binding protein [Clavulina sp. PMI_390]|nr:NAD(P)-binding protein [Clavulina sp. PMI_390]